MPITALIFIALYFICLIKAFSSRPIWGLFAYLIAFYMHPQSKYWAYAVPDIRWSLIAGVITLIALIVKQKDEGALVWLKPKENKWFLIFVTYVSLQYFWALNPTIHAQYIVMSFKFLILMLLIQNALKTEKDFISFIIVNALGAAYVSYIGISQHSGGRFEGIGGPGLSETNEIAQHLGVVLIISAYVLLCKLKKHYLLLAFPLILILQALMLTGSRGSIAALVIAGVVAVIYMPKRAKKKLLFFASIGAVAFSLLLGPEIIARFSGVSKNETGELKDKSANSRIVIASAQLQMFKERPFIGHGHKGTIFLSPFYIPKEYLTNGVRASHNFILAMLVDHGLLGCLPYFMIILVCILKIRKASASDCVDTHNLQALLIGCCIALIFLMVGGLGSNNKVMEVDIWLYALIINLAGKLFADKLEVKKNLPGNN